MNNLVQDKVWCMHVVQTDNKVRNFRSGSNILQVVLTVQLDEDVGKKHEDRCKPYFPCHQAFHKLLLKKNEQENLLRQIQTFEYGIHTILQHFQNHSDQTMFVLKNSLCGYCLDFFVLLSIKYPDRASIVGEIFLCLCA